MFVVLRTHELLEVATEVMLTSFSEMVVRSLERAENEDDFDTRSRFSPLPGREWPRPGPVDGPGRGVRMERLSRWHGHE